MAETPVWKQTDPYLPLDVARRPNVVSGQRVPRLPWETYISPAGNLVRVAVGSTRNFAGAVEAGGDPKRSIAYNRSRAIREKFIPWEWPLARDHAPWLTGGHTEETWKVWREEELQRRRAEYNDLQERTGAAYKGNEDAAADAVISRLAQRMAAIAKPQDIEPVSDHPAAGKNVFAKKKGE